MTKWHAHVAHMAKHMNVVGTLGPGPLPPPKSGADRAATLGSPVIFVPSTNITGDPNSYC